MIRYEYTVTLADPPDGLEDGDKFLDFAEQIYSAFDGDVEVEMSRGAVSIAVEREATSMVDAVLFTLRTLDKLGLTVSRFGPEGMVTAAEIAARLKVSRERVNQLAQAGTLPTPLAGLEKRSPMYRWSDVVERLGDGRFQSGALEKARSIERANAALTLYGGDIGRVGEALPPEGTMELPGVTGGGA
jgi:hypothetical protein